MSLVKLAMIHGKALSTTISLGTPTYRFQQKQAIHTTHAQPTGTKGKHRLTSLPTPSKKYEARRKIFHKKLLHCKGAIMQQLIQSRYKFAEGPLIDPWIIDPRHSNITQDEACSERGSILTNSSQALDCI